MVSPSSAAALRPGLSVQAAELARALRNLPEDVKKYKTIAAFEEQAKEFLDRCAAGAWRLPWRCARRSRVQARMPGSGMARHCWQMAQRRACAGAGVVLEDSTEEASQAGSREAELVMAH